MAQSGNKAFRIAACAASLLCACGIALAFLPSCSSSSNGSSSSKSSSSSTPFTAVYTAAAYDDAAAQTDGVNSIDVSHVADGYIGAAAVNSSKLKLQVTNGNASYNYDLPTTGEAILVPVNMGNGIYTIRIMQNTSGNRYVELFSVSVDIALSSETAPYVRPNVFCSYSQTSACVQKANELCADAKTDSEAFDKIFDYISKNIAYDYSKADYWATESGYTPNPDETLATGSGICFDYASLTAAMLRSQGIPYKMVTGYVSPNNIYHAWDMVYIDGGWSSLHISAPSSGDWARADLTFAAAGASATVGDGSKYTDKYVY